MGRSSGDRWGWGRGRIVMGDRNTRVIWEMRKMQNLSWLGVRRKKERRRRKTTTTKGEKKRTPSPHTPNPNKNLKPKQTPRSTHTHARTHAPQKTKKARVFREL